MHTEEVHVTLKRSTGRTRCEARISDAEKMQQISDILMNETTAVVAVVSGVDTATLEPVTEESEVVSADVSAASWLESVARLSVPDGDRTTTKVMT